MKKFFSLSILLILAIVINSIIPFAEPVNSVAYASAVNEYSILDYVYATLHGIDGSGGGIVDQYWYTKLIKLDGYNQKKIKGTLHYEIVPDESITAPYSYKVHGPQYKDDPDNGANTTVVTVRKGITSYAYDVPFSSDDFVDEKFNQLCRDASTDFGRIWDEDYINYEEYNMEKAQSYIDLMDHVFLHEWGSLIVDDSPRLYRVGKVLQSHFDSLQEYIDYLKANRNNWIKWENDPETYVTGYGSEWKGWEIYRNEENYDRPLISVPNNLVHLGKLPEFRNGTFKFSQYYTKNILEYNRNNHVKKRNGVTIITRPIAISKTYDSNGNITSIEKPLLPSVSYLKFHNLHADASDNYYYDYDDGYSHDEVYRYIIREKPSSDVPLWHEQESYVLDVVHSSSYGGVRIYIHKNKKEAEAHKYTYRDESHRSSIEYGPFPNEVTKRVQVISHYGEPKATPTPVPTPTDTSGPGNGARDHLSWGCYFGPAGGGSGFIDQAWYTKLIDLRGYQGKDIEGTLHFELEPDSTAHDEYIVKSKDYNEKDPDDPKNFSKVKVVPGLMKYKYDIPFSSNDFVDEEFNKLTRTAKTNFTYDWNSDAATTAEKIRAEHIRKLFSHAFMHEWGTVGTSDNSSVFRVGKVEPSDFQSKEDFDIYNEKMKNSNQWVNWKNDPEKQVTGYCTRTNYFDWKKEAKYNRSPISLDEHVYKHIAEIPEFVDGTMNFGDEFIYPGSRLSYTLYVMTRNIAISKTYDSAGNITSVEKPLFPSVPLLKFLAEHNEKVFPEGSISKSPYKDIDDCDYVFRYILREKDATGVDLTPMDEEIIVEVAYQRGYNYQTPSIRIFRNEEKAKKNRYTYRTVNGQETPLDPFANETTERLQVANRLRVPGYPQTGDNSNIWLYIAMIAVALTTAVIIIRKRKIK